MRFTEAEAAYVTLALVRGVGRARLDVLLSAFETPARVLGASPDALREVPGISTAVATAIAAARVARGDAVLRQLRDLNGVALLPTDERFPRALREVPDAPTLLFAKGNLELLQRDGVAIVGSRDHSRYGAEVCRHFATEAARAGLAVISGMARGLDAVAHRAALDVAGATVGVLGNGLGVVYPSANEALYRQMEQHGCLLSEFPPGERPRIGSFPKRNRLISGLARVTLVVEARAKSGALITADCALVQGKEVLAVPGLITNPMAGGCNKLIQQGAKACLGVRDLLEEYGLHDRAVPGTRIPFDLSPNERQVLDILGTGCGQVDEVAHRLGQPAGESLAILTSLEIRGLVIQEPGKVFRRSVEITDAV